MRLGFLLGLLFLAGCATHTLATSSSQKEPILILKSELKQGGYLLAKVDPRHQVIFFGKKIRKTPEGEFFIGFDRDAAKEAIIHIQLSNGKRWQKKLAIEQRKYDIQKVTGVPKRTVEPKPEDLARIAKEAELMKKARAKDTDRQDFLQNFQWPLQGRISGVYGSQRVYNGKPGNPHFGVDIARPAGTIVKAPNSGKVTLVYKDMFFSGGTLVIDHGYGVSSTFIHLSEILVKEGQEVKQGDPVAKVGATGRATGPHLDWRINWYAVRLDAQLFVPPMPETAKALSRE